MKNCNFLTAFTINSKPKEKKLTWYSSIAQFVKIVQNTTQECWIIKRNNISGNTEEQRKVSVSLQHQLK